MLLSDRSIEQLIQEGVLSTADGGIPSGEIGPVSYDLTTSNFRNSTGKLTSISLAPGDSIFVESNEIINLPSDLAARVLLRKSRIRQGLSLAASLCFSRHETLVYYRVTNVSASETTLNKARGIAQLVFEKVDEAVEYPYEGTFNEEFDYRGLGDYEDIYKEEVSTIQKKTDEIAGIEKRMYGNVLALMAIFAAIFTLVNINAQVVNAGSQTMFILISNLFIIGSFSFFGIFDFIGCQKGKQRLEA